MSKIMLNNSSQTDDERPAFNSEMRATFEIAVASLEKWLQKYGHPNMIVVADQKGVEAYNGEVCAQFKVLD